jgi:cation transport regulator ChaC
MVRYFAYGSNMNLVSLRAKGVEPRSSARARRRGWTIAFDVRHWFKHEGGVGNIHPARDGEGEVQGVVHECDEAHLALLDLVESAGVGYRRADVEVETAGGVVQAVAYVGMPGYLDPACLPTRRYLNILVAGATSAGLDEPYLAKLRAYPTHAEKDYPPFEPPDRIVPVFDRASLAARPEYTALAGAVFDMSACRKTLDCVKPLFGGKDTTLFHLKRLDSSTGRETLDDVKLGRISEAGRRYLNAYLHEYAAEYRYVGRFEYP